MATGIENLIIYRMASDLECEVFKFTKSFPADERFRTVDQSRRSSSSVTSNIAEGYRKQSYTERRRILGDICCGEAEETINHLLQSARKGLCDPLRAKELAGQYRELIKAIYGFLRYLRTREVAHTRH